MGWAEPWLLNGTSCEGDEPVRLLYLLYLPLPLLFWFWSLGQLACGTRVPAGQSPPEKQLVKFTFSLCGWDPVCLQRSAWRDSPRWHQAQAQQPAAVAQLPPLPLPPLWPSMTQNEKFRKHRFWEWKKAHGGKMLCCV